MTATHYLRLDPPAYRAIALGQRNALVMATAERVAVGDQVVMREWRAGAEGQRGVFTGNWTLRRVTDELVGGPGLAPDHAIYSLGTTIDSHRAVVQMKRLVCLAEQQGVDPDRFWRHQERLERTRRARLVLGQRAVERVLRGSSAPSEGIDP